MYFCMKLNNRYENQIKVAKVFIKIIQRKRQLVIFEHISLLI